ncbi:MAG: right-handed parallel beta-helix repeat-containing protein [Deltaproteobacteria bacterium]|nr:right-handed parallel beta-helix repeat-containing protein [Deltaproteobacteria bacterium]
MKRIVLLSLLIQAVFLNHAFADTPVAGNILSDTVWNLENSPYLVTGTVSVYPDRTLTIEPGVEVRFEAETELIIGGELIARGEEGNMITFTSAQADPISAQSYTITFNEFAASCSLDSTHEYLSGSIIAFCIIEKGHGIETAVRGGVPFIANNIMRHNWKILAIFYNTAPFIFKDNSINNNSGRFFIRNDDVAIIRNNRFFDNNDFTVSLTSNGYQSAIVFKNNLIEDNSFSAFGGGSGSSPGMKSMSAINITNNIFKDNSVSAALATFSLPLISLGGTSTNRVSYCDFTGNSGSETVSLSAIDGVVFSNLNNQTQYELYNYAEDVRVPDNWWGTDNTSSIDRRIFDYYDDMAKGEVAYTPIATEPFSVDISTEIDVDDDGIPDHLDTEPALFNPLQGVVVTTTSTTTSVSLDGISPAVGTVSALYCGLAVVIHDNTLVNVERTAVTVINPAGIDITSSVSRANSNNVTSGIISLTGLPRGTYSVTVTPYDAAGNTGDTVTKTANVTNCDLSTTTTTIGIYETSRLLGYQGYLTDKDGTPLNGSYAITFRVFDNATQGNVIWLERHQGGRAVTVRDGLFSVTLGQITLFPKTIFYSYYTLPTTTTTSITSTTTSSSATTTVCDGDDCPSSTTTTIIVPAPGGSGGGGVSSGGSSSSGYVVIQKRWLSLEIKSDGEMLPRQRIVPSPYTPIFY